jgi:hypothetical protein
VVEGVLAAALRRLEIARRKWRHASLVIACVLRGVVIVLAAEADDDVGEGRAETLLFASAALSACSLRAFLSRASALARRRSAFL